MLDVGARKIVLERAEIDLVIDKGPELLEELAKYVGLQNLIFEAGPRTPDYPQKLLALFGPRVNLGNIALQPSNALDGILILINARYGLDRSVGYSFIRKIWGGPINDGDC